LGKFIPKNPHLLSQNGKIWREGANLGVPPHAKFCKKKSVKEIGAYTHLGKIYTKKLKPLFTPDKHFQFTVTGAATYPLSRGRHHAVP